MSILQDIKDPQAYWISPHGKMLPLSSTIHIKIIFDNPEAFGLNQEYLDKMYDKTGEPKGSEGKARVSIMKELARKGWIRIRFYRDRNQWWSVLVNRLDSRTKDNLFAWAQHQLTVDNKILSNKYNDVIMNIISTDSQITMPIGKVAEDALFNECVDRNPIAQLIESVEEFEKIDTYDFAVISPYQFLRGNSV